MDDWRLFKRLGKILKNERERRKFSQEQLLFLIGIDKSFISQIERGTTNVSIKTLYKFPKVFKFKLSELSKKVNC